MTPTGYIGTCTPIRYNVNIRERASTSAKICGVLMFKDHLPVCVVGSEWLRVEFEREERFIARHVVSVVYG